LDAAQAEIEARKEEFDAEKLEELTQEIRHEIGDESTDNEEVDEEEEEYAPTESDSDDEETIAKDEKEVDDKNKDNEINMLENDAEVPLEELIKLYYPEQYREMDLEVQELPEGLDVDEGGQIVSNELFSVVAHVDDSIENGLDHADEMPSAEENNAADNLCQSTLEETMEVLSGSDFIVKVDSESLGTIDIPQDPVQSGVVEIGDDTNELGHNKISIDLNEDAHNNIEESTDSSQDLDRHTCNTEQPGDGEELINNVKILDYNDESIIHKDEPSHDEPIDSNSMCVENNSEPADHNDERAACNENTVDHFNDLLTEDVTTDHGDEPLDMEESLNSVNNESSVDYMDESVDIDDRNNETVDNDEQLNQDDTTVENEELIVNNDESVVDYDDEWVDSKVPRDSDGDDLVDNQKLDSSTLETNDNNQAVARIAKSIDSDEEGINSGKSDDHTEKPLSCDENNPNNDSTEKNVRDSEENME